MCARHVARHVPVEVELVRELRAQVGSTPMQGAVGAKPLKWGQPQCRGRWGQAQRHPQLDASAWGSPPLLDAPASRLLHGVTPSGTTPSTRGFC